MTNFKYTLKFQIHYHTNYHQFVIISGNIAHLGRWNLAHGLKMNWNEGDFWKFELSINLQRNSLIEYKYVICEQRGDSCQVIRWEDGPNRLIDISKTSKLDVHFDDSWELRKITLRLLPPFPPKKSSIFILGDCPSLGEMQNPQKMNFTLKKDPFSKILERFWELEFFVSSRKKSLRYYYLLYDEKNCKYYCERGKERSLRLDFFLGGTVGMNDCLYFRVKMNKIKKIDKNFQIAFNYHKVNENLIIGSFPYTSEEVDLLEKEGVKIILNINELQEFSLNMINWDVITKYYPEKDFELIDFQIFNNNDSDPRQKIRYAAFILHNLIIDSKVYVHSTVGISKLIEIILDYLIIYKRFSCDAAAKFLKNRCVEGKKGMLNEGGKVDKIF